MPRPVSVISASVCSSGWSTPGTLVIRPLRSCARGCAGPDLRGRREARPDAVGWTVPMPPDPAEGTLAAAPRRDQAPVRGAPDSELRGTAVSGQEGLPGARRHQVGPRSGCRRRRFRAPAVAAPAAPCASEPTALRVILAQYSCASAATSSSIGYTSARAAGHPEREAQLARLEAGRAQGGRLAAQLFGQPIGPARSAPGRRTAISSPPRRATRSPSRTGCAAGWRPRQRFVARRRGRAGR